MVILASNVAIISQIQWGLILGGFGLFLFGMNFMGEGLKSYAGDQLKESIEKYAKSPWQGIVIGTVITAILQSSSATTAITIGLVRAKLMKLQQAAAIIIGANIGTTMTAFLIGIDIEEFAVYFIFVGALLAIFSKLKKYKYLGNALLGFGILFFGMRLMGNELGQLQTLPIFNEMIDYLSHNAVLSLIGSTVFTGLIQSSSATIGIIQKLYETGSITLLTALPLLLGSNIGTTITAILASLGGNRTSQRAALVHVLFNLFGSILFMIFLPYYATIISYITDIFQLAPMMEIAMAHIVFNITVTLLFYPFISKVVGFVKVLIKEEDMIQSNLDELNIDLTKLFPVSALEIAKNSSIQMGNICRSVIKELIDYFNTKDISHLNTITTLEESINAHERKITEYLVLIAQSDLGVEEAHHHMTTMQNTKIIKQISDFCISLSEYFEMIFEDPEEINPNAKEEINEMLEIVSQMFENGMKCYEANSVDLYHANKDMESHLDILENRSRSNHFSRISNRQITNTIAASVFVDIISTIERMGIQCCNIARYTIYYERAIIDGIDAKKKRVKI